jgi:Raf kinase inhibitor-like YbhB/YbcL family protein
LDLSPILLVMLAAGSAAAQESDMRLASAAFEHEATMPVRLTCEGENQSPPLQWSGVPMGTRSLALIVDDPDAPDPAAPKRTFVHWVVYDIEPKVKSLDAGASAGGMPPGARQGSNDRKRAAYDGPCPPIGRHRYFHKLYALDTTLGDKGALTKAQLEEAMKEHIIATAELIGTYEKTKGGGE